MNNPSPSPTPLQTALERYKHALNCITASNSLTNKDRVLEILSARDALGKLLETESSISPSILSELIKLDSLLKEQAYKITQVDVLPKYQSSFPNISQAWLSELETAKQSHPWNSFEWWLKGVKILIWTVNLALFSTLATRFLSGGYGFLEVALIAFPGVLSLLQLQKELTKGERKRFYKLLQGFNGFPNIAGFRKVAAIFISTVLSAIFSNYGLLMGFFLLIWFKQPFFAQIYKNAGKTYQTHQNLVVAEQKYLKAIALDSDNFDAHYKLATLYEELQEVEQAKKEYIIAIKGDHLPAYNNLAYWYIKQDKAIDAIALLEKSWDLVREQEQPKNFEKLTPEEKQDFRVLKYNLAKNLGWAMLEVGHDEDAQDYLEAAIELANKPEVRDYVKNPGAAHCLYAKLLEKQAKKSPDINRQQIVVQTKKEWQQCKDLIQLRLSQEEINTEEYQWLYEARQKINSS
jgi:Tetratricopeptide repeat